MAQQLSLREKISSFLAGNYQLLEDHEVTEALPSIIANILERNRVAERLIRKMVQGLENSETSIRQKCGACLNETTTLLTDKKIWQMMDTLLSSLEVLQQGNTNPEVTDAAKVVAADGGRVNGIPVGTGKTKQKKDTVALEEERIFHLYRNGDMAEAKQQLVDLVVSCARKKDFKNAERLRERICEIDPMALSDMLQLGKIIDEEKSSSINEGLLEIWFNLLKVLTREEFINLYLAMEKREIQTEETLVAQGTKNNELFFINNGSLRISYFRTGAGGSNEIFLEDLVSGQIASEDFFNASLWTVSLTAGEKTQVSVLRRDDLAQLEEQNPGICSKLQDYILRFVNFAKLLSRKGLDRRIHARYKMQRTVHFEIIGKTGNVLSNFNGAMEDISQCGMCLLVRIINKENSRFLLGRDIKVTIPFTQGGEEEVEGTIIGVQLRDGIAGDFSGHVKFKNMLERQTLKLIIE